MSDPMLIRSDIESVLQSGKLGYIGDLEPFKKLKCAAKHLNIYQQNMRWWSADLG